jgi:DNA-binding transcriptional regulator YdaS (Cro superfamily)
MTDIRKLLEDAVRDAGSQAKFGQAIGLSQQGVSFLMKSAKKISPLTAIKIEKATKGKLTRQQLRPDVFGEDAA